MTTAQASAAAHLISARFLEARRAAGSIPSYPGDLPTSLDEAYAIQDLSIADWGQPVIGWKVGRINPPLSTRYDADRLAGPMFYQQVAPAAGLVEMPVFSGGFAAGEAEFLLRIGRAPRLGQSEFTLAEVAEHIAAVHVGIEIASSPLGSINAIGPVAVVSDFGNNNGVLIGQEIPNWQASSFEEWPVTTLVDGVEVGTGTASAFPNAALGAAKFLFELMAKRRIELEPGQWISSGAVTGVHDARPGQTVTARFDDRFTVECRLIAAAKGG